MESSARAADEESSDKVGISNAAGVRDMKFRAHMRLALLLVSLLSGYLPAFAAPGDLMAIVNASTLDRDAKDSEAIATVCTACHSASQFLGAPRSNERWRQVFEQMVNYGAHGTDEQFGRVVKYLLENLTIVNVNTSPVDELAPSLQITQAVARKIVSRRSRRRFSGMGDLENFAGVNESVIQDLNGKHLLQF
jgi:DNA uptake protein ComE-like DNA-binding protein